MNLFTKEYSFIMKGIAILFMIIHHTLISDFYIYPDPILSNWWIIHLSMGMKLCVGIYTFIIGYAYACTKDKTFLHSISRIWKVLKIYWLITIVFFVPVIFILDYNLDIKDVIYCAFGLKPLINCSSWFIYFYIYAMLLLRLIHRFLDEKPYLHTGIIVLLFAALATLFQSPDNIFGKAFHNCCFYTPILAIGYLFKTRDNLLEVINRIHYKRFLLLIILLLRCFLVQIKGLSLDIVFVPFFIAFSISFFEMYALDKVKVIFYRLGVLSVYMWFIHSMFFSTLTKSLLQKFFLFSSNPTLVFVQVFVFSYCLSEIYRVIEKKYKLD